MMADKMSVDFVFFPWKVDEQNQPEHCVSIAGFDGAGEFCAAAEKRPFILPGDFLF